MIKGFIATASVGVFMLVCLATDVSAGGYGDYRGKDRGSPYGDYQKEECERVCHRSRPYCHSSSFARKIGDCWTCCKIKQKWFPHDYEKYTDMDMDINMDMDQDHEVQMDQEKSEHKN